MTFTVQGTVEIDGKLAKLTLKGIGDEAKKAGDGAQSFSNKGKAASSTARGLGDANKFAAGSVSNLTAQFNDIGVMLAAGQNPLQLAIQQGTQITQVFGNAGAAQAGMMLKQALVSMISPLNLITIGGIAAGAALIQWLSSGADEAADLSKAISDIEQKISDYIDLVNDADSLGGSQFENSRRLLELTSQAYADLISIAKIEAFKGIDSLNSSLVSSVVSASWLKTQMADVGDLLNLETVLRGNITAWKDNREQVSGFIVDLETLENAVGLDAQYAAAISLRDTFKQTVDVTGELTTEQLEFWKTLSQTIQQMEVMGARIAQNSAGLSQMQLTARSLYASTRAASDEAALSAQDLIADLRQEASIRDLILRYGSQSAQVTRARLSAERAAFVETTRSSDVAESLKTQLIDAWDASKGIAGIDMSGGIIVAVTYADQLAQSLGIALGLAQQIARIGGAGGATGPDEARGQVRDAFGVGNVGQNGVISITRNIGENNKPTRARTGRGGGAAKKAAREAEREQKAIDDLIASQQRQLDVLRVTDPVQKEMIQNREILAKATDTEREAVKKLISTRIEEEGAIERATQNAETFKDTTYDALDGLILRGEKGRDVIANLADSLAQAASQSLFLGQGFLADIFGTSSSGGLLGSLASFLFPGAQKNKDGGIIYGAGGPRDDLVPALVSPGEFHVNAQATAANRGLLEYINAGGKVGAGFANGGYHGPASAAAAAVGGGNAAPGRLVLELRPSPDFDVRMLETAKGVTLEGIDQYRTNVLQDDLQSYSNDPTRIG